MPDCSDRSYFKRRAQQELEATLHADGVESEIAHNQLTGLYLEACVQCAAGGTEECEGCGLKGICDAKIKPRLATEAS